MGPHSQLITETKGLSKMRNKNLDVESVTNMVTQKKTKSPCWHYQLPGHRNRDCPKRGERGRSKSRGRERGRNNSTSRQRGQSSKRRKHSPYPKRKGKKKG